MVQIVLRSPPNGEAVPVAGPAAGGDRNFFGAGEILAGDGCRHGHDLLCGACGDDLAAVDPGGRADIHNVVRGPHGVLVVLHHNEGVAQVPQALEGVQKHVVVPLVQADGGLVQNVQHPHEGGADLGGQPNPLALAAGQGARLAAEGQIGQPHALQEGQAGADLLEDLLGNLGLGFRQGQMIHKIQGVGDGFVAEFVDIQVPYGHRQGLLFQPAALAGGAGALTHAFLQLLPGGIGLGFCEPPLHVV